MMRVRPAAERGHFDHGWLETWHTFSFADYHDPEHMGFRALRVVNEDYVRPGAGFPAHGHRDMEILTWVLEGALEHRDSYGGGGVVRPGDAQRMTAGTGITHSEQNHSQSELVHLYQIWLRPDEQGLEPGYEQKHFDHTELEGRLRLVASRDARDGSLAIHADADVYAGSLAPEKEVVHELRPGRHAWLQVASGRLTVAGVGKLHAGDGLAVSERNRLTILPERRSEVLLFDLA